jgi:hypothetical protein
MIGENKETYKQVEPQYFVASFSQCISFSFSLTLCKIHLMNILGKKQEIKSEIDKIDDEKLIWAIARLLHLDEPDIPEWHKQIVMEREEEYNKGTSNARNWDEVNAKL